MRRVSFVIALAILSGSTVNAATTEAENASDPVLHPYQESATTRCSSEGDCALVFPEITTGTILVLHASCLISIGTGGSIAYAQLSVQLAKGNNQLPPYGLGEGNGVTNYAINAQTYLFYTKGERPRIDVFGLGSAVQVLSCTLSGHG
jgi:hypothetical protein